MPPRETTRKVASLIFSLAVVLSTISGTTVLFTGNAAAATTSGGLFSDDFEDEPADTGVPDAWTDNSSSTSVGVIEVTSSTAAAGSQSFHANESDNTSGNLVRITPNEQPYSDSVTNNVSLALRDGAYDHGTPSKAGPNLDIVENGTVAITVGIHNGTLEYKDSSGTLTAIASVSGWTNVTVYSIDPSNDTFAVKYPGGTATGLSMYNAMTSGYDSTQITVNAEGYADDVHIGANVVSGRAVTQSGAPIDNATVIAYGSKKPDVSQARNQLSDLADQSPPDVSNRLDDLKLMGSGGSLTDVPGKYALAYSPEDLSTAPWVAGQADLSTPYIRNAPAGEPILFVVGDASASEGLLDNEHDRQVPGDIVSGTVVVERIGPNNDTVSTHRLKTKHTASEGSIGPLSDPSTFKYAKIDELPAGYYRVKAADGSFQYPMKVGEPVEIMDQYLENTNDQITDHAQQIQDSISGGSIVRKTTTTNASGYYSVSLPSGVKAVQVQAVKAPGVSTDPKNLNLQKIRSEYDAENTPDASIYLPSRPKRVEVPSQDVDIYMTELTWPPASNLSGLQSQIEELREQLRNEANNVQQVIKTVGDKTKEQLQTRYAELAGLIRANPALEEAYLRLSDRDSVASASDLSKSELRTEIQHMNQAIAMTAGSGTVSGDPPDTGGGTVTKRWTVNGVDLSQANVSVIAHWSNGSTQPVADKYISVNDDMVGDGGTVVLKDYPLGDKQPAAVSFSLTVAGQEGVARGNAQVKNPTFTGDLPALSAVEFSTLVPGPDDTVEMQLHPDKSDRFGQVQSVTVYAPDGSTVPATITADDTVRFDTSGVGTHTIEATVTNAGGTKFTETFRVRAASEDVDRPPSITASSSPVSGAYAVVGDGLSGGDVEIKSDKVLVTGQIPTSNEAPRRLHVYTSSLSSNVGTPTEVQIVQGESEQQVRKHLYVTWHTKTIPDSGIVWREDNQPLTRDGGKYGSTEVMNNQTVVETYTTAQGEVTVDVSPDPGLLERAEWTWRTNVPEINVPGLMVSPTLPIATP